MTTTETKGTGPEKRKAAKPEVVLQSEPDNPIDSGLDAHQADVLVQGRHHDPHSVLVATRALSGRSGPAQARCTWLSQGPEPDRPTLERTPMRQVHPGGLWEGRLDPAAASYKLEALYGAPGSPAFVFDDPYRYWPTLGDLDLHLFNEGRHRRLWEVMGAHPRTHQGTTGTAFAVWAPNAKAVRVVGDWNSWTVA